MAEFVRCINAKCQPEVSVYDGTKCTEIAYACKKSFESGALVQI